ncbi:MAG: signal peptidase I [Candidatus Moranbacteria bacterium]|nr:signal peptidase I [Candidatus Moranbacteria bacterium]
MQQQDKPLKTSNKIAGLSITALLVELGGIILMALIIVIPIKYFLIQPFIVKGASMEPNFHEGEYLIINEIGWKFKGIKRGEVLVFKNPGNKKDYFIKRVVGLPNEKVEIKGGRITIFNQEHPQGMVLDESEYLPEGRVTSGMIVVELTDDEFFVLGDNRSASSDSRYWGPLPEKLVVGKAWVRAFPFGKFTVFSSEHNQE